MINLSQLTREDREMVERMLRQTIVNTPVSECRNTIRHLLTLPVYRLPEEKEE